MAENYGDIEYLKKNIIREISDQVTLVKDVADYEKTGFTGFPAVTITVSGNGNSFVTSAENERVFMFLLRVYEQIEQVPAIDAISDNAKERAERVLGDAVDQILRVFDTTTRFTLTDSADRGIEAVPSRWGYSLLPVGWCRVAEIEVRAKRTLNVVTGVSG